MSEKSEMSEMSEMTAMSATDPDYEPSKLSPSQSPPTEGVAPAESRLASLFPAPLDLEFSTTDCAFCPGKIHVNYARGNVHEAAVEEYDQEAVIWKANAKNLVPDLASCASCEYLGPGGSKCAVIGISMTSVFDAAHIAEMLLFCTDREFRYVRFVLLTDPSHSNFIRQRLQRVGLWANGTSIDAAAEGINPKKSCRNIKHQIRAKFRIVRRAVEKLCNDTLIVLDSNMALSDDAPRFAWIDWKYIRQNSLYQTVRAAVSSLYQSSSLYRADVLSITQDPVRVNSRQDVESLPLSPAEEELFTDYYLCEQAFFAVLPTLLLCESSDIFMPYHCHSRALPCLLSNEIFDPVMVGLVEAEYAGIRLTVLPTTSSRRLAEDDSNINANDWT
jgi:hypothetical protein